MNSRLQKLRTALKKEGLDAIVITHMPDVRYLCGFSGSAGTLCVTPKNLYFITDGRYETQAADELGDTATVFIDRAHFKRLADEGAVAGGMTIGFQDLYLTVARHDTMKKAFTGTVKLRPVGDLVRRLTAVKTEDEIALVRKAASIAGRVYREILQMVRPGMRENEIAAEISYLGRKHGSEGDAFDIIVASGHRSALPHGRASTKKLKKGELVTLDFGCIWKGFNSDMTRTFAVGDPGKEARKIYDIVYRSEREGVRRARAGMKASALDRACRAVIEDAGYGEAFSHSTGHGLGIEVHEYPPVSHRAGDDVKLRAGTIVTIEPGIYLPGTFGVRIEDDVVVDKGGCRELTNASRKLIVV